MSYMDYLGARPFSAMMPSGGSPMLQGGGLSSLMPSIQGFLSEQEMGMADTSDLAPPSMEEARVYGDIINSLFEGGIGDMPQGDVMADNLLGSDYVQSQQAYL